MKRYQPYKPFKDWRDENMPVSFCGKVNGVDGVHEIESKHIQEYFKVKLESPFYTAPTWREDETYDLRSKRKR